MSRVKSLFIIGIFSVLCMVVMMPFCDDGHYGIILIAKTGKKYYLRSGVSVAEQGNVFFVLDGNGKPVAQFMKSYYDGYQMCDHYPDDADLKPVERPNAK